VTAADVYGADVLCALRESPVISAHHHLLIITGPAETHKHTQTHTHTHTPTVEPLVCLSDIREVGLDRE